MKWLQRLLCEHQWQVRKLSEGGSPMIAVFIDKRGWWRKKCVFCGKTKRVHKGIVEFPRNEVIV